MHTVAKENRLLTVAEVASTLRLSRQTIDRLIDARVLPAHRVGAGLGSLRVDAAELGDYLESRSTISERRA
jgi:excisionase family DNA binding protein